MRLCIYGVPFHRHLHKDYIRQENCLKNVLGCEKFLLIRCKNEYMEKFSILSLDFKY